MISSAEAAAYIRSTALDDASMKYVSRKVKILARLVKTIMPKRYWKILKKRAVLAKEMREAVLKLHADTIIELGSGYNTLGSAWLAKHPDKQYIEVDLKSVNRRKRRIGLDKRIVQIHGNLTERTTFSELRKRVKGNPVFVIEGVLSYCSQEEIISMLYEMQQCKARILTHETDGKIGGVLRTLLWGKKNPQSIKEILEKEGWTVRKDKHLLHATIKSVK